MSEFGGLGVFPFQYGGGNSRLEEVYLALRKLMGNVPAKYGTIEDLWRASKAIGLVMAIELPELAVIQALPKWATVGLTRWEKLHGLPGEGYEQQRRDAVVERETTPSVADIPSLEEALAKISAKLTIVAPNRDTERVGQSGRTFGPWGTAFSFSQAALYSDSHVLRIHYALDVAGGELVIPTSIRKAVADLLNDRLPMWDTWRFETDGPMQSDGGPNGDHQTDQTICSA